MGRCCMRCGSCWDTLRCGLILRIRRGGEWGACDPRVVGRARGGVGGQGVVGGPAHPRPQGGGWLRKSCAGGGERGRGGGGGKTYEGGGTDAPSKVRTRRAVGPARDFFRAIG